MPVVYYRAPYPYLKRLMMQTFNCPSCSGPLEYTRKVGSLVRCRFCGQSVIVPERVQEASATPEATTPSLGKRPLLLLLIMGLTGFGLYTLFRPVPADPPPSPPAATRPALPAPSAPNPPPAHLAEGAFRVVLSFGEEGVGPGHFEDARHIALDGDGFLYVGEYSGGRIQRFDPTGRFMTQWLVDTERPLRGLAADRNGFVYAVQGGKIQRYRGETGEALGSWAAGVNVHFDGVYPAPDGGLLAFGGMAGEGLVAHLDAQGQARLVFETQPRQIRAALDGLGNTYALGSFSERGGLHEAVFKYDPAGTFLNRFGSAGGELGQFRAAHSIAVDGRGRVYVSDINGFQVFDSDGRFLERLDVGGSVFGFTFNDQDELFLVERNAHRVMKVVLNEDR